MQIKIFPLSAIIAFSLLGASYTEASSVSYSTTSSSYPCATSVGVSQFNSSLGTLTGVLVEGSFTGSSALVFTNNGPSDIKLVSATLTQGVEFADAAGHSATATVNRSLSSGQRLSAGGSLTLNSGSVSGSTSFSLSAAQAAAAGYLGSGSVIFDLANSFGASPQTTLYCLSSYNTALSGTAVGMVRVTYTYTPIAPVPEPSSWILSLGGIAGLGGLGMIRQRKLS